MEVKENMEIKSEIEKSINECMREKQLPLPSMLHFIKQQMLSPYWHTFFYFERFKLHAAKCLSIHICAPH